MLLLLGERWIEVAPVLRVLALYGGLLPIFHNVKNLFYGLGQTSRWLQLRLIQAGLFVLAVAAGALSWRPHSLMSASACWASPSRSA